MKFIKKTYIVAQLFFVQCFTPVSITSPSEVKAVENPSYSVGRSAIETEPFSTTLIFSSSKLMKGKTSASLVPAATQLLLTNDYKSLHELVFPKQRKKNGKFSISVFDWSSSHQIIDDISQTTRKKHVLHLVNDSLKNGTNKVVDKNLVKNEFLEKVDNCDQETSCNRNNSTSFWMTEEMTKSAAMKLSGAWTKPGPMPIDSLPSEGERLNIELPPDEDNYEIDDIFLESKSLTQYWISWFLSFIEPNQIPIELFRDVWKKEISVITLIFKGLPAEGGFLTCISIALILALVAPIGVFLSCCSSFCYKPPSGSLNKVNYNQRCLSIGLFINFLLISMGIVALIITNERVSSSITETPKITNNALNDILTYCKAVKKQLTHLLLGGLQQTLTSFYTDLEDIGALLGRGIQSEMAIETGIDITLDALKDVCTVLSGLSKNVDTLTETSAQMSELENAVKNRLHDLRLQIDRLVSQCSFADKIFCDAIESSGLEVVLKVDNLRKDSKLLAMRNIGFESLYQLVEQLRMRYVQIPNEIVEGSKSFRQDVKITLDSHIKLVNASLLPIENVLKATERRVNEAQTWLASFEDKFLILEHWRWLFTLVTLLLMILIWLLLGFAVGYSCCDKERSSRVFFCGFLLVFCLFSLYIWIFGLVIFIIGGHGEILVCRPLYDSPKYTILSKLIDFSGVLNSETFEKKVSLQNESIVNVLNKCETNAPAYKAFHLQNILNIDLISDHRKWGSFTQIIQRLYSNFTKLHLTLVEPKLQDKLTAVLQATLVNMTTYRKQLSKMVVGKDLNSFAKQLENVAHQIKDLSTATRLDTLASRTRRLLENEVHPLVAKKEELLFYITSLEVQLNPLQRQVNQSLSHLKTIQYFIDNQGPIIIHKKIDHYITHQINYLEHYRRHIKRNLNEKVALCRPLWNVFNFMRFHFCHHFLSSLNGSWISIIWCLMWFTAAVPFTMRVVCYNYLHKRKSLRENRITSDVSHSNWGVENRDEENTSW